MVIFKDITEEAARVASAIIRSRIEDFSTLEEALPSVISDEVKFYFKTRHSRFCEDIKLYPKSDIDHLDISSSTRHYSISFNNGSTKDVKLLGAVRIIIGSPLPILSNFHGMSFEPGKLFAEISRFAVKKKSSTEPPEELGCPSYVIHAGLINLLDELSSKYGIDFLFGEFLDQDFLSLIKRWVPGTEELGEAFIRDKEVRGVTSVYGLKIDVKTARKIGGKIKKFLMI